MMSVNEYAIDVNLSVDKIISLCQKLGVQVNNGEDMLDDDAIIMLDNEIAKLEAELADEQAKVEQDNDKIAEIEANLASLLEKKSLYEANSSGPPMPSKIIASICSSVSSLSL